MLCRAVEVNSPRINQRQVEEGSNEKSFESVIFSPYTRRSPKVKEADLRIRQYFWLISG
jgi:hypothetical protein